MMLISIAMGCFILLFGLLIVETVRLRRTTREHTPAPPGDVVRAQMLAALKTAEARLIEVLRGSAGAYHHNVSRELDEIRQAIQIAGDTTTHQGT